LFTFLRYLRFLLRSIDESLSHQPTLASLKNEVELAKNVSSSVVAQLAVVSQNQDLDHAGAAEEKDGRLNET
jgi:hypothetical protein